MMEDYSLYLIKAGKIIRRIGEDANNRNYESALEYAFALEQLAAMLKESLGKQETVWPTPQGLRKLRNIMELQLREHQQWVIDALRDGFKAGHRAQLLYAPTGFGKTEVAISLMKATADNYKRS